MKQISLEGAKESQSREGRNREKPEKGGVCVSIDRAPPHREEEGFVLCLKELCLFEM